MNRCLRKTFIYFSLCLFKGSQILWGARAPYKSLNPVFNPMASTRPYPVSVVTVAVEPLRIEMREGESGWKVICKSNRLNRPFQNFWNLNMVLSTEMCTISRTAAAVSQWFGWDISGWWSGIPSDGRELSRDESRISIFRANDMIRYGKLTIDYW